MAALPALRFSHQGKADVTCDALVIGGGIAGPALAAELARAGRSVILCEREKGPHDKVCGEFISREGQTYLKRLGVAPEALGAVPVERVRLVRRGERPIEAKLPFKALSLSRRVLDDALMNCAERSGAEVRRGARVKTLAKAGGGWLAAVEGGGEIRASAAFLATGKHDLRGWKRPPGRQPDLLGFKAYWRLSREQAAELMGHIELILFPAGYAGLQPVEDGRANLCLLVRKGAFASIGSFEALIAAMLKSCPHLRRRLRDAEQCLDRPIAISQIPYGYVCPNGADIWRLGDQAAVVPSFSGDGMSIALHSAVLAAQHYLRGDAAATFQRRLAADVSRQVGRATAISKLLVTDAGQRLAIAACGAVPPLMPTVAALTRIPQNAIDKISCAPPRS